ncbi:MAG: YgaP family membrane protein [Pseudobdellovibrionaceae bacterium]
MIRLFFGFLLLAYAFAGGPVWAYIGLIAIPTAAWGFCPFYSFFKIKTLTLPTHHPSHLETDDDDKDLE